MKRGQTLARKNFHIPLPEDVYESLRDSAAELGRPATQVALDAIRAWIESQRQIRLHREIAEYAKAMAGTAQDLDDDLEAASLEMWRPAARSRKHR